MFFEIFNPTAKKKKITLGSPKKVHLIAVLHYADWCETSQMMQKKFEHLKNRMDGKGILCITLDFTNNTTMYQSELLASALGISHTTGYRFGTGSIILIDHKTNKALTKFTAQMRFIDIATYIIQKLEEKREAFKKKANSQSEKV